MKATPIRALKFQLRILKNDKKSIETMIYVMHEKPLVDKTIKKIDAKIKQFEKAILILKNN